MRKMRSHRHCLPSQVWFIRQQVFHVYQLSVSYGSPLYVSDELQSKRQRIHQLSWILKLSAASSCSLLFTFLPLVSSFFIPFSPAPSSLPVVRPSAETQAVCCAAPLWALISLCLINGEAIQSESYPLRLMGLLPTLQRERSLLSTSLMDYTYCSQKRSESNF